MAHFAELDENNVVLRVIVVSNDELLDENGVEQEAKGIAFCESLLGGRWLQTSYNGSFRKNFAGAGHIYYPDIDAFSTPQPLPSWSLNPDTGKWGAPIPYPTDGFNYIWDEDSLSWVDHVWDSAS
jgi:hypothetical protein